MEKTKRLYFIDNLRLLFILGLIFLHSARPYIGTYGVYTSPWFFSDTPSLVATIFYFLGGIDSFSNRYFLIAGYFTYYALQKYPLKTFIIGRSKRLLVPFIVAFPFVVPISYYIAFLGSQKLGTMFPFQFFFPGFRFNTIDPTFLDFVKASITASHIDSLHLWFLPVLFVVSATISIIYVMIRKYCKSSLCDYFSQLSFLKFMLILSMTLVITIIVGLEYLPSSRTTLGWFSAPIRYLPMYVSLFIFGMLTYKYKYLELISIKLTRYFLSIASMLFLIFLWFFIFHPLTVGIQGFQNYQIQTLFSFFGVFFTYFSTIGIVGLFYLYLNTYCILDPKYIRYFILAYIIHFPFVLFGQYVFLGTDINGAIKFLGVSVFTIFMTAIFIYIVQYIKEIPSLSSWESFSSLFSDKKNGFTGK